MPIQDCIADLREIADVIEREGPLIAKLREAAEKVVAEYEDELAEHEDKHAVPGEFEKAVRGLAVVVYEIRKAEGST